MNDGLLRKVVDITWGYAHGDESVPSSEIVGKIVAKAHADTGEMHISDEMILACIKASDSNGIGAENGSYLWEMTERGLRAALACR